MISTCDVFCHAELEDIMQPIYFGKLNYYGHQVLVVI